MMIVIAQQHFFDSPFIPEHMIVPMENPPVRTEQIDLHNKNFSLFDNFEKIVKTAGPYGFSVRRTPQGILFISHTSSTYDLRNREIPQAILITEAGKTLISNVPDVLSKIERHQYPERQASGGGYSGKVSLVELPNGQTVAVKRFNRYKTGEQLPISGHEQADVMFKINQLDPKFRCPTIYTVSQDIMIMEDISTKQKLQTYECSSEAEYEQIITVTMAFQERLIELFQQGDLIGHYDTIAKHLYIDKIENGEFYYVLIDPNS